jgi:hypothetical protein
MKRYIGIDKNNIIIDLFFEDDKNKFDGTEILLDEVESKKDIKINGQYRSDDDGVSIFKYENGKIKLRSKLEIENDSEKIKAKEKKESEELEEKIQAKLREIAIAALQADGEI